MGILSIRTRTQAPDDPVGDLWALTKAKTAGTTDAACVEFPELTTEAAISGGHKIGHNRLLQEKCLSVTS